MMKWVYLYISPFLTINNRCHRRCYTNYGTRIAAPFKEEII